MNRWKIIFFSSLLSVFIIIEAFLGNYKEKLREEILNETKQYEQLQIALKSVSAEYSSIVSEPKLRQFAHARNFINYNSLSVK
jgi:hypothetical protein